MENPELRSEVAGFFDDFVVAFQTFDGAEIARRYVAPHIHCSATGQLEVFTEHAQIAEYFQRAVDTYYASGCRSCSYNNLAVEQLGEECVLGTVTWDGLKEDQTVLASWRESYNLCRRDGRLLIFASVIHST